MRLFPGRPAGRQGRVGLLGAAMIGSGLGAVAVPFGVPQAFAQAAPSVSQAVVQPVPGGKSQGLNAALARLARNPRDGEALIDAGKAALAMGDVDAAVGFYTRADQVLPGNPRVKAGLASALVRGENPFEAIPLFAEAERAGPIEPDLAADRGLAYDLVGDNARAQAHYRDALARGSDDEVLRRLAVSFAIAGDKRAAEETLAPLVARQDKAALRSRAFALAILGQPEDGVGIAYASLPAELAAAISPYLRYMPRLTPAQQAAAANFGHFPRASEIGRDDPRVAQYAAANPRRGALASADAALIPKGEPLGRNSRRNASRATRMARTETPAVARPRDLRSAPPEVAPTREVQEAPSVVDEPARRGVRGRVRVAQSAPKAPSQREAAMQRPPAPPPVTTGVRLADAPPMELPPVPRSENAGQAPVQVAVAAPTPPAPTPQAPMPQVPTPPAPMPQAQPPVVAPVAMPAAPTASATAAPGFDLAGMPGSSAPVAAPPAPAPVPENAPPVQRPRSLAEAFSDLARPTVDTAPASGAVDIRRITPARETLREDAARKDDPKKAAADAAKSARPARPAPPSHPSRIWVQIATGRDKGALAFDWRRLTRQAVDVFRGKTPSVSAWGQTNRLLTGPFPSQAAANAFIAQLGKADIDGSFVWTSPAGQVVDALAGR